jgi:hypothetical protein
VAIFPFLRTADIYSANLLTGSTSRKGNVNEVDCALSVKAFAVQFGLGPSHIEIWQEMENYASYDRIDEELDANPQKYAAFGEAQDLFEWGQARVMGDWPESHWSPPEP